MPKHSAAAKTAAAGRVSSLCGHPGLGKLSACHVSSRPGLLETGAELDRESVATTLLSSQSTGRKDIETQNVVHSLRNRENLHKILERKVDLALGGGREAQQKFIRLRLRLRREIGKREILISHFRRSIKNVNLRDFTYIKHVDG